jgi:HlyD family secretion protein
MKMAKKKEMKVEKHEKIQEPVIKESWLKKISTGLQKALAWFKEKRIRWIIPLIVLAIVVLVIVNGVRAQKAVQDAYQTIPLKRGDLVVIVGATGTVEANQTVELAWQTTGRVKNVNAKVNDHVKAGDILADLEENTLPQSIILAQADLVDAKKALDDVINSHTETATAYSALLDAEQNLRDEAEDRDQWNYHEADIDRVNDARAKFIAAEEDYKIYKDSYEAAKKLPADDPQRIKAKKDRDDYKLVRDKALRTLNYILGKAYGQQVAEDFAAYDVAKAKLDDAQREWNRVKSGPNADDISAAEAKVAAAEATVSMGRLEAPFNGTVTQAEPKAGDQISEGTLGFRLDDLNQLFMDVQISEVDINRVKVGQKADLSFDAINGVTYTGEVTEVARVGVDNGSGVDFTVRLRIIDPDEQVRPGMTAAVNIVVSQATDVLTVPSRAVRLKDGKRIVYILQGGAIHEVEIQVGASSDTSIEIMSGDIKEGDLVVLNPPFDFNMSERPAFEE